MATEAKWELDNDKLHSASFVVQEVANFLRSIFKVGGSDIQESVIDLMYAASGVARSHQIREDTIEEAIECLRDNTSEGTFYNMDTVDVDKHAKDAIVALELLDDVFTGRASRNESVHGS